MTATIQDVARVAGVSVSTVSNVLNGRTDRMRSETLSRVKSAITMLEYRPSKLAQQLKTGHTPLLGLLVPSLTNPMYGHMAREIESYAQQKYEYRLLIGSTYRDRTQEIAFIEDLLAHGVRRVIVISSLADERHLESAVERGMVVVSYDRGATPGKRSRVSHVMPDNYAAARLATSHLIAQGHRRIAFVTVAGMTMSRSAKIDGFHAAADEAGLRDWAQILDGGALDEYGDGVIAEVGRATAHRIATMTDRPTGLVALNDLMAIGLIAGLREVGLQVPHDVSVVGMDGIYLAGLSNPSLSTVQLPVAEMMHAMVDRAMQAEAPIDASSSDQVLHSGRLVVRESVAAPPVQQRQAHLQISQEKTAS
jgi:DNA-binding LacI/PurR family transcriptional regulator